MDNTADFFFGAFILSFVKKFFLLQWEHPPILATDDLGQYSAGGAQPGHQRYRTRGDQVYRWSFVSGMLLESFCGFRCM